MEQKIYKGQIIHKIIHFLFLLTITLPSSTWAHTLLLNVLDNEDNTIHVEGMFSTGKPAHGAQILLKSLVSEKILYKKRLPLEGELTIKIPKESYQIILNGGVGHTIVKKGIAPIEGFSKINDTFKNENPKMKLKDKDMERKNIIVTYGLSISFILLFLTLLISIKNTNKIISILRNQKQ